MKCLPAVYQVGVYKKEGDRYRNRLPREVVAMKVFKNHVNVALSNIA